MPDTHRRRWIDRLVAVLLGGGAFTLYVVTLAPTVLAGDGGEFQFVPYLLGVAHPTGYPLYCLLGWAWSHLVPIGDIAYRMNLFSAFWAALAVGLLYPTALAISRQALPSLSPPLRRTLAALAATTFAVTPTLWSQSIIAEVYSLHIFFIVLTLYLLLTWVERRDSHLLLLAACCFGLSLAHHRTTLLLAPAILAFVWLVDRRALADRRLILKGLLLAILPLCLYLYIPWRAPHTPYLRLPLAPGRDLVLYENTLDSFQDLVLGGPFGGSVDLTVNLTERLVMAAGLLRAEIGWLGMLLGFVGLLKLIIDRRWALLAVTSLTYLAIVAFNLVYTIGDIFVMFIPSYLIVVLWMMVAVGTLASLVGQRRRLGVLIVLSFFLLPLWMAFDAYTNIDQSQNTSASQRWQAILSEPLPQNAILISNDRNNIMPMWYYQYVGQEYLGAPLGGSRPDLLGLFPLITPDYSTLGQVLDLALGTGRQTYLIKEMPGIEVKVQVKPEGRLWRVLGPASQEAPHYSRDERLAGAVTLVGYDQSPHSPHPGEPLNVTLYWQALQPLKKEYHTYVHLVDRAGQMVDQSDQQPGGVYYPTTLWQPGEQLRDDHVLTIPSDTPLGVYRLEAGMYALSDSGEIQPLGEPLTIGQVAVKDGVPTEPGDIGQPVGLRFGDQIELVGYGTQQMVGTLAVTLHWRCIEPPEINYIVFVHLLDAGDQIVVQHDGQPQSDAYPTSVWDAGEVVADEHHLSLPSDLPPGDYRLRVGLYLPETGERLPVEGGGDGLELGPVKIAE